MDLASVNERIELYRGLLNSSASHAMAYADLLKISQKLDELINLHYALSLSFPHADAIAEKC
ncbi:Spo0E family sporulation regulatory protein-aspartic acid phosphatase [Paenibacillus sp. GCM10023250]|uniref:Spo0E family sporulation regulatory protein-aspartic acid phosphatase n=1 Tax=Paenibacillus sp. GCM10023250 TaxID=3252648 RepID=UPI0036068270